jgi:hypothetical protein
MCDTAPSLAAGPSAHHGGPPPQQQNGWEWISSVSDAYKVSATTLRLQQRPPHNTQQMFACRRPCQAARCLWNKPRSVLSSSTAIATACHRGASHPQSGTLHPHLSLTTLLTMLLCRSWCQQP